MGGILAAAEGRILIIKFNSSSIKAIPVEAVNVLNKTSSELAHQNGYQGQHDDNEPQNNPEEDVCRLLIINGIALLVGVDNVADGKPKDQDDHDRYTDEEVLALLELQWWRHQLDQLLWIYDVGDLVTVGSDPHEWTHSTGICMSIVHEDLNIAGIYSFEQHLTNLKSIGKDFYN